MALVLGAGMFWWRHWTTVGVALRVWHLVVLVAAGGATYAGVMVAAGFRMRELRGPRGV
jgi:putative peptidoglycan lipid II flippase